MLSFFFRIARDITCMLLANRMIFVKKTVIQKLKPFLLLPVNVIQSIFYKM